MKFSSSVLCGLVLAASTADVNAFVPSGKAARFAPTTSSSSTFQIGSSTVTESASINGATSDDDTATTTPPAVPEASTSEEEEQKEAPKVETVADIKKDEPEPVVKKVEVATPAAVPVAPVAATPAEPENTDRIEPGRFNDIDYSIAIPFMKRPKALDGSHAGDFGFDPLGLSESNDLYTMQEAELRHARLAMLAVVGWPLSELVAPSWMLQDGCAPSVLNGFNPLSFIVTVAIFGGFGFFEYMTALRPSASTEMGKLHHKDMEAVWQYGVAGDYNFDPLNLYSSIGDSAKARKGLREVEISHGRSAMLGITGFVVWEKLTGHPIVENSMFFHPNAMLPLLAVGYFFFNQVYEVSMGEGDAIRIEMSDEGNAKVNSWTIGLENMQRDNEQNLETVSKVAGPVLDIAKKAGEKAKQYIEENTVETK